MMIAHACTMIIVHASCVESFGDVCNGVFDCMTNQDPKLLFVHAMATFCEHRRVCRCCLCMQWRPTCEEQTRVIVFACCNENMLWKEYGLSFLCVHAVT